MLNQHAKGGTPVADVIARNDAITEKPIRSSQGVPNHGGAQVSDVHLLGHIGGRVVDHDSPWCFGRGNTETGIGYEIIELASQEGRCQCDVQKAGAGNLNLGQVGEIELSEELFGDFAWRATDRLSQAHHAVGLVVSAVARSKDGIGTWRESVKARLQSTEQGVVGSRLLSILSPALRAATLGIKGRDDDLEQFGQLRALRCAQSDEQGVLPCYEVHQRGVDATQAFGGQTNSDRTSINRVGSPTDQPPVFEMAQSVGHRARGHQGLSKELAW